MSGTVGGLALAETRVEIGGTALSLWRPGDPEVLLDERAFREAEFMPYWAELWPSGVALAEALAGEPRCRMVELGCGLGLPSLLCARWGHDVLATDWSPHAISVLRHNAQVNGLALRCEVADWSDPPWFERRGPFDRVVAADVLYERRHVGPLLELFARLRTEVWLADPGRQPLDDFLEAAADHWLIDDVAPEVVRLRLAQNERLGEGLAAIPEGSLGKVR